MEIEKLPVLIQNLYDYIRNQLAFDKGVSLSFDHDHQNAQNVLGKTAHYNPDNFSIVINTSGRHPKDILRSFAHELVHHSQNCKGNLRGTPTYEGYAQNDKHLREMEREAYEVGNMLFRDWEDGMKRQNQGEKQMNEKREKLEEALRKVITEALTKKAKKKAEVQVKTEEKSEKKVEKDVYQKLYENSIKDRFRGLSDAMISRYEKLQEEGKKRLLGK